MVSKKHTALSGEKAVISRKVGGPFTAWNGHLTGVNLALRRGKKIVQAWRATGWWPDHYSIAIFNFQQVAAGTKLTFTQIGIPPNRYSGHYRGWIETYWTPMQEILRDGHLSQKTLSRVRIDRPEGRLDHRDRQRAYRARRRVMDQGSVRPHRFGRLSAVAPVWGLPVSSQHCIVCGRSRAERRVTRRWVPDRWRH